MKFGISTAMPLLLLLMGAAACHLRGAPPSGKKIYRAPAELETSGESEEVSRRAAKDLDPSASSAVGTLAGQNRPESIAQAPSATVPTRQKLLTRPELCVTLTMLHRVVVEEILEERDEDIRRCQEAIHLSRILDVQRYQRKVCRVIENGCRKIDDLLDRTQYELFVALVDQGFFNEGLAFTHGPGTTVME